jgi:ParB family chromosome partitioning protein
MQAERQHERQGQLRYVTVDAIKPPSFELRSDIEQANDPAFQELCNSVRETGVIEPLIARPAGNGKCELIAGGRRFRAAMLAGLKEVPVIVKPALNDIDAKILALSENLHRKDLSPTEKSRALIALYEIAGYPEELSLKYLMRLCEDNHRGEAKRADAIVVPHEFRETYKKIGLTANRQWQLLKFAVLDDDVLDYAREKGLNGNKILMLTQKGIVERGVDVHKRIIDHICNLSEYEAREYIHVCSLQANRRAKEEAKEEAGGAPVSITFNSEKYGEVGLDIVDYKMQPSAADDSSREQSAEQAHEEQARPSLADEETRYTMRGRSKASKRLEELAYLSVHDLCLPAQEMALLRRRATLKNCDLGEYLTYILLFNLKFRRGKGSKPLSAGERVWLMKANKGCATVKTQKEKEEEEG